METGCYYPVILNRHDAVSIDREMKIKYTGGRGGGGGGGRGGGRSRTTGKNLENRWESISLRTIFLTPYHLQQYFELHS